MIIAPAAAGDFLIAAEQDKGALATAVHALPPKAGLPPERAQDAPLHHGFQALTTDAGTEKESAKMTGQ